MSETSVIERAPSAFTLPVHTFRLLVRCLPGLVLWFALGRLVRWGLLFAAANLSYGSWYQARLVGVLFLFTLVVMVSLATVVGMLYTLREALLETWARRAAEEGKESIFGALNRTALVFAGLYMTWGFVDQDLRDFENVDRGLMPDREFADRLAGRESTLGEGLTALDVRVSLAAMVVAYLVKWYFGRRHEANEGRFSGIFATFGELAFVFYGLNATVAVVKLRADWIGSRAAVTTWNGWTEEAGKIVPGWETFWSDIWPLILSGLAYPLAWLTVGILVYGAYAADTQTTIRGTRLESAAARVERTHSLTRAALGKLTGGLTSRWIPLLNSLRMTIRGGAPLFGLFALLYGGLHIGGDFLARAGAYLTAGGPYLWMVTDVPVSFVVDLLVTLVSMALIAATFDLAATRDRLNGGSAARPDPARPAAPTP
ncbi:hypothetical protein [Acrocarpospora pleiomorpha]|uniref:hypothetical protein n=1 Tax=Acrocarpospora pleiomorpha TaxID=90975 RepID=UPI0012D349C6|nr:hypothetical protein [Acrocarpospora pleiomorpha]